MSGLLNIGSSGLLAAQAGIATTGHNIANVNTPGYSRQETLQSALPGVFAGGGFFGQGTRVDTVRRIYSEFLAGEMRRAQADSSYQEARDVALGRLDQLFGEPATSLAPSLEEFFASLNTLAANPADLPSRQLVISTGQGLVARLNLQASQLAELRDGLGTQLEASVRAINGYATEIASLNRSISLAQAGTDARQPPNDLLDQRDALLQELNKLVGATGVPQGDGSMNVFLANGQGLVVGQQAYAMSVGTSPSDPRELAVGLQTPAGFVAFRAADIPSGTLGGLLNFRDAELETAENTLGRIALVLAGTFNAQHRAGVDLAGAAGLDFFSVPAPLATTQSGGATLAVTVSDTAALTTSDYRVDYDGTNFTVTRLADGTTATVPPGGTVDGLDFALATGTLAAGDRFLVQPTRFAAGGIALALADPARVAAALPGGDKGDNRNALALASLSTQKIVGGTSSLGGSYGLLVSSLGALSREAGIRADAQAAILAQAKAEQESVSGVNLDEEAVNLQRYQQAYQAAGKLMATAAALFQTILDIGG